MLGLIKAVKEEREKEREREREKEREKREKRESKGARYLRSSVSV
jgi:hypothetical protein